VSSIQSVEDLSRKKIDFPKEERILPADSLWILAATAVLLWVSSLLVFPKDF